MECWTEVYPIYNFIHEMFYEDINIILFMKCFMKNINI